LEENKAFGELAYNYDVDKASNFYYDSVDTDEATEEVEATNNSLNNTQVF
jgi:hypothetical protein